jgi:hypothetical protein
MRLQTYIEIVKLIYESPLKSLPLYYLFTKIGEILN